MSERASHELVEQNRLLQADRAAAGVAGIRAVVGTSVAPFLGVVYVFVGRGGAADQRGGRAGGATGGGEPQGLRRQPRARRERQRGVLTSVLRRPAAQQAVGVVEFVSHTLRAFGNRILPRPIVLPAR